MSSFGEDLNYLIIDKILIEILFNLNVKQLLRLTNTKHTKIPFRKIIKASSADLAGLGHYDTRFYHPKLNKKI